MADKPNVRLECLGTEDGEPWGVYAYGHVDLALITLEMVNNELDYSGFDPIDPPIKVEHLWMLCDEGIDDYPFFWCAPNEKGATAVTGVRF